jgi:hypothetical protein
MAESLRSRERSSGANGIWDPFPSTRCFLRCTTAKGRNCLVDETLCSSFRAVHDVCDFPHAQAQKVSKHEGTLLTRREIRDKVLEGQSRQWLLLDMLSRLLLREFVSIAKLNPQSSVPGACQIDRDTMSPSRRRPEILNLLPVPVRSSQRFLGYVFHLVDRPADERQ